MKKYTVLLVICTYSILLKANEDISSGILMGKNISYSLSAPIGWVLDTQSGVKQGLYAVFYRNGESWSNAEVVMYTNTSTYNKSCTTIDELISYDENSFKKNYTDINIIKAPDIIINNNLSAKVNYLSGISYGNFEAIAYINAESCAVMIVISSKTKNGLDRSLEQFISLVKSYKFIANKLIIKY